MEYRYAENANYEDYASGRVLYHTNGVPNFPVRLICEIYGRCLDYSIKKKDICLYDCCCGGGYSLTILGLLQQQSISEILASDIDGNMIQIAEKNLSLLSKEGMNHRLSEIHQMYEQYQKSSHREAEESVNRLLSSLQKDIPVTVFEADVMKLKLEKKPDIIITDVPYGDLVEWQGEQVDVNRLMDSISEICSEDTIVAICMNKTQKVSNTKFLRLEKQIIGKRKFEIVQLIRHKDER